MEESLIDWVALQFVKGLGTRTAHALLERFGTPAQVFRAKRTELAMAGLNSECLNGILDESVRKDAANEIERAKELKIDIIPLCDERYPKLLKEIFDPPIVLYIRGDINVLNLYPCIAVVGTRTPTQYGINVTERLSFDLSNIGMTIISGLARGIDSVAHKGALHSKGKTAAVLGSGVDVIYPKENKKLMERVLEQGAVLSEFPLGTGPAPQNFPIRNRIISGLSLGTVIVEASEYSGSLITARMTIEQNREIFAVPGYITSGTSFGPNYLIKQGAKLVQYWRDVVDEMPSRIREELLCRAGVESKEQKELPLMSDPESRVFEELKIEHPKHIDKLYETTRLDLSSLNEALLTLEMKGLIRQLPGKNFVRKWAYS